MLTRDLESLLVNWSVAHSGHEDRRTYIGLSGIGDCERALYDRYYQGLERIPVGEQLKHRISYEAEAAAAKRLSEMGVYTAGEAILLYDGMVQGHTDGRIGGDLLEIKTVAMQEHFPDGRLPRRVYYQVQAYLHYLEITYAHVLYLSRMDGAIRFYGARYNPETGLEIHEKVAGLVRDVRGHKRPRCTCGRCVRVVDGPRIVKENGAVSQGR